jgi:hypothetical protein
MIFTYIVVLNATYSKFQPWTSNSIEDIISCMMQFFMGYITWKNIIYGIKILQGQLLKVCHFFQCKPISFFFSMQSKELKLPWRLRFSLHIIKILLKPFVSLQ